MMFSDLSELPEEEDWDFCVVGSGVMGLAMARYFEGRAEKVLLIEAGGDEVTEASQDYYRVEAVPGVYKGWESGRFRVYGGSTERWGGQAMRFDGCEFSPRDWVLPAGWPIDRDALIAHYESAEQFLKVDDGGGYRFEDNATIRKLFGGRCAIGEDRELEVHFSKFTSQPRLRLDHHRMLQRSENISTVLHARAVRLDQDQDSGVIKSVVVRGAGGYERKIYCRNLVCAMGAIECCRFLLIQRDVFSLRFASDLIGERFQEHPGTYVGTLRGPNMGPLSSLFRYRRHGNIAYKARLSHRDSHRHDKRILGVTGTVLFSRQPHPLHPHAGNRVRRMVGRLPTLGDLRPVLRGLARGKIYSPLHYAYLAVGAEDARSRSNFIRLSESEEDADGLPRALIHYSPDESVVVAIQSYIESVGRLLHDQGIGHLDLFPEIVKEGGIARSLRDVNHHIGGLPMARSPEEGVTDTMGRVFGVPNLYVLGTAILPTGGFANPTLTALALAYRTFAKMVSQV